MSNPYRTMILIARKARSDGANQCGHGGDENGQTNQPWAVRRGSRRAGALSSRGGKGSRRQLTRREASIFRSVSQ
jgi:hypothetical protein